MGAARSVAAPTRVSGISVPLAMVLLAVAVGLAYCNTLKAPFIFDDGPSIGLNESIRHLWPLGPVLHPPTDGGRGIAGRPVVNLTLAVNYALSGLEPWSYHLLNLLIHAAATLALFGLARRTLDGPVLRATLGARAVPLAFVIALVWAVHPLQTESVTCVIQRTESLVGLFYLLTLYGFTRAAAAEQPAARFRWSLLTVGSCLLGMATKEVMVTAPMMVLLFDRTFLSGSFREAWRQRRWLYYALIATWALLFHLLAGNPLRGGTAGYDAVSWWQYLLTQCRAVVLYLKLSLWPHPLVLDYGTGFSRTLGEVWPQSVLLVALAAGTVWAMVKRPVPGFLGAWWFVILSPSSSIVPLATQTIAEHRVYLPLAAVVALISGLLAIRAARLLLPVSLTAALLLGAVTLTRNQLYHSPEAMWRDNLAHCPENARTYVALAAVADREQRFADAILYYEEYMRRKPDDTLVEFNLVRDLVKVNRRDEAIQHFEKLTHTQAGDPEVHINYGAALIVAGRFPEAVREFETVLRLRHNVADDQFNLAEALLKAGRGDEALPHYAQAVALKPDVALAQYRYGDALLRANRPREAATAYFEAVRLKPDLFEAWVNLGGACLMLDRVDEAVRAYEAALRLKPDDAACRRNLDYARSQLRR